MIFNHPIQILNSLEGNQNYFIMYNSHRKFLFIKDFLIIKIIVFIIPQEFKVILNRIIIITTILTIAIIIIAIIVTTTTIIIIFSVNAIIHNINIIQNLLGQIQTYFMNFLLNKKIKRKFLVNIKTHPII